MKFPIQSAVVRLVKEQLSKNGCLFAGTVYSGGMADVKRSRVYNG